MDNEAAKNLITRIFKKITTAKSLKDLSDILGSNEILQKNQMDNKSYPPLELTLTPKNLNELREAGLINSNNLLVKDLSSKELSPLEKLLYSIVWKNGDLKKERHIIEGVESIKYINEKKSGVVFFQFGKHLAKRTEPIIDQHVLRAFGLFFKELNNDETIKLRKKNTVDKKDANLIEQYKRWLISDSLSKELIEQDNYTFHIDKVLFALGKSVKLKKNTKL